MAQHDLIGYALDDIAGIADTLRMAGTAAARSLAADLDTLVATHRAGTTPAAPAADSTEADSTEATQPDAGSHELDLIDEDEDYEDYEDDEMCDDLDDDEAPEYRLVVTYSLADGTVVDDTVLTQAMEAAAETLATCGELEVEATDAPQADRKVTYLVASEGEVSPGALLDASAAIAGAVVVDAGIVAVTAVITADGSEVPTGTVDDSIATLDRMAAERDAMEAEMAAEEGRAPEVVATPHTFVALFTKDDGTALEGDQLASVLVVAEATLVKFGNLAVFGTEVTDEGTEVTYTILESGALSARHLSEGTAAWGGTLPIPGVGRVTAKARPTGLLV